MLKSQNAQESAKDTSSYHSYNPTLNHPANPLLPNKPLEGAQKGLVKTEEERAKLRQEKFQGDFSSKDKKKHGTGREDFSDMIHICDENDDNEDGFGQNWKVVGTSMELEKPYVRLTREPDPSMIRPESVLKQSLEMILDKWKKEEVTTGYVLEQFRSIRQDLTVQQIKDEFTARVYEENIRVSLRCQNINYFNQCLSQLMDLYKAKIRSENKHEFLAYRIIFYTLGEMETELNKALLQLTPHDYDNPQIKLALSFRQIMNMGNWKALFKHYRNQATLVPYVIDFFLYRIRIKALQSVTKSFGEKTSVSYLQELLGFTDLKECVDFISSSKGVLSDDNAWLMNKVSFKVYDDHPWMRVKLTNYKLLVAQNLI